MAPITDKLITLQKPRQRRPRGARPPRGRPASRHRQRQEEGGAPGGLEGVLGDGARRVGDPQEALAEAGGRHTVAAEGGGSADAGAAHLARGW